MEQKLVLQDVDGKVLRAFNWSGETVQVIRRQDTSRLELVTSLTELEEQEIIFENAGSLVLAGQYLRIIAVVKGTATVIGGENKTSVELSPGQFCLIPACLKGVEIKAKAETSFLCVEGN